MALTTNGRISLYCFCVSLSLILIPLTRFFGQTFKYVIEDYWLLLLLIYSACIQVFFYSIYKPRGYAYKVAWRAGILGQGFGIGLVSAVLTDSSWKVFGIYISILCFFHYSEYLTTAVINPKSLSLDSFLINHSREYGIAAVGSWMEFLLERYFCPGMKEVWWLSLLGFLLCVGGETMRKMAMLTAGSNFNHIIQSHREEGHVLVTHGVYSLTRHPAYVGWFWWSVGTQLLLCNPVCLIGYTVASWKFFKTRIIEEEITLLNFFGEDYVMYQKRVGTGLPFIRGYRLEL
ncbi:protein-S-isoprenylcysteine O-methyltransferase-like [Limulus polyphemus]|uniref:Protein-S-isoprenylcysteine O-methyltransferase n=1 Tax=Limulus polyphemus TaxID=6850 RepID=A0ABM1BN04_LIMPO|nr:protein-S-isoprenylcysteine O-methyltransferase-like [Limulus polyphemus]